MPPIRDDDPELTVDAIYRGELTLIQPRQGYRFALDALLLADFVRVRPGQRIVDLGTGAGIIALALARRMKQGRVWAVEIQPRLAECARQNVKTNALEAMVDVLEMNWSKLTRETIGDPADSVVCNPPYRRVGTGRINPAQEDALARHEIAGSLGTATEAAARLLVPGGAFTVIYPAARLVDLLSLSRQSGLEPKRLRLVHSRSRETARLVLLEARLGGGEELEVMPPLIIYRSGETYSREVEAILAGTASDGPGEPTGFP